MNTLPIELCMVYACCVEQLDRYVHKNVILINGPLVNDLEIIFLVDTMKMAT